VDEDEDHELNRNLIARGPEPYEIGMTQQRLAAGVEVKVLPSLYAPPSPDEFPSAWEPALLVERKYDALAMMLLLLRFSSSQTPQKVGDQ
jgi:hypothetical protein